MRTLMARRTQPNQVPQPMRVRPTPTLNVMHLPHWGITAMLTNPITSLEHLPAPLRVDRITLASPIRYGPHRISLRSASSNVRLSTIEK